MELFRYWVSTGCESREMVAAYTEALESYARSPSCDQKRLSLLTLKVAEYVRDSGNLKEAVPLFQRALVLRQKIYTHLSAEVAQTVNEIGRLYYRLGRNAETLEMWEQAYAIREETSFSLSDIGVSLNNLGLIYHRLGRLEDAERAYQQCTLPYIYYVRCASFDLKSPLFRWHSAQDLCKFFGGRA